jgi:hypothetical protein
MRREGVIILAQAAEVHDLRDAGSGRSISKGAGARPVALGEVGVSQGVHQVEGDVLAIERRPEAPNVAYVTPYRGPRAAVVLRTACHGGDVVACRIERGRDMPADKPGGAGHKGLHLYSKPIGWPSITGSNYPPMSR